VQEQGTFKTTFGEEWLTKHERLAGVRAMAVKSLKTRTKMKAPGHPREMPGKALTPPVRLC